MLTPAFNLTQDYAFLMVSIQVPWCPVENKLGSEYYLHFDDYDFVFSWNPYHLRLNLPGKVIYRDEPRCEYDFEKKIFKVFAPKAQEGETFEGLDLINLLLKPKECKIVGTPKIEVLESTYDNEEIDEEFDWSIEQVPCEEFGNLNITGHQCGFANNYSFSVFNLKEETREIFDVFEPQAKTPQTRSTERIQIENKMFDEEHYLADLYDDEEIRQIIMYNPEWNFLYGENENNPPIVELTSKEKERLRKLPCKEYLLDKTQKKTVYLGLIDILFAYAYNKRTTKEDNTVESPWTINKISATLSWLETYSSIEQVTVACIRRSLIYPLFRHFELSRIILEDVRKIMILGKNYIIKCLLEIYEMFNHSKPRYLLNDLFITDYIVWIQSCPSTKLVSLAAALEKVSLTKRDMEINLVDIETFAEVAWMSRETLLLDSNTARESETSSGACQIRTSSDRTLSSQMEKLSLDVNSRIDSDESNSEYEECSSSTSETDNSVDSDDSVTDSDDDSETFNNDNNSFCCSLRGGSVQKE